MFDGCQDYQKNETSLAPEKESFNQIHKFNVLKSTSESWNSMKSVIQNFRNQSGFWTKLKIAKKASIFS